MIIFLSEHSTQIGYSNGKAVYIAQLMCDNKNDLRNADEVDERIIAPGSIAYLIQSGEMCLLSGDTYWYTTDGDKVEFPVENISEESSE